MLDLEQKTKLDSLIDLLTNVFANVYGYDSEEFSPSFHYSTMGQIGFDCPVCSEIKGESEGDGKANLEINYQKGLYKCWACYETHGTSGTIRNLIKKFGNYSHLKTYNLLSIDFVYNSKETLFETWDDFEIDLDLPEDFVPVFEMEDKQKQNEVLDFLKGERKLTDDIIYKFNIGFTKTGFFNNKSMFKNMIIFPSYNRDGELNYFIGRRINDNIHPKYMLLPNSVISKQLIVFNEYHIDWNKAIFLVEGVLDHLSIPNSIPLLGKYLNDSVWQTVYNNANNYVIIMLDGEAMDDAKRIYSRLNGGKLINKVLINDLGDDDPSSFYQRYGLKGWSEQIKNNSFKF